MSSRRNPVPVTQSTFNRITRLELRWHPYRMHVRHELLDTDWPRLLRFSNWFNRQCEKQDFLDRLIIGDEARFEMNGKVNTQNVCRTPRKDTFRRLTLTNQVIVTN